MGERQDILDTFPQGRDRNYVECQAIEQILAKLPFRCQRLQIGVG